MKALTRFKLLMGLALFFLLLNGWEVNPFYPFQTCSEKTISPAGEFERPYLPSNSGLLSRFIRTIKMTPLGLWIGYAGNEGIGFFDGKEWINWTFCGIEEHVNTFAWSQELGLWAGTDSQSGKNGMLHYEEGVWYDLTAKLPDARVYDLVIHNGCLYASTWDGVAQYCGGEWSVPYTRAQNIFENNNHTVAFMRNGDIIFGAIDGVSTWFSHTGTYRPLATPEMNTASALLVLTTPKIRAIREHPTHPSAWIVGDGGDLSILNYVTGKSTTQLVPGSYALDIEFDYLLRPWVAGTAGVHYYEKMEPLPMPYDYSATAIEFGCEGCVFGPNQVFIALEENGLIHTTVPPRITLK